MRNRKIWNGFPKKIQDPIPLFFPSQNVLTFMLANRLQSHLGVVYNIDRFFAIDWRLSTVKIIDRSKMRPTIKNIIMDDCQKPRFSSHAIS